MVGLAVNATGNITFKNIILRGFLYENGGGRNNSAVFRINVLFHTLQDV